LNRFFGQLASKPFSNGTRTKVRFDGTEAASRKTFLNIARRTTPKARKRVKTTLNSKRPTSDDERPVLNIPSRRRAGSSGVRDWMFAVFPD
jgi:hypothetical protein